MRCKICQLCFGYPTKLTKATQTCYFCRTNRKRTFNGRMKN